MSERIDHVAEARKHIDWAHDQQEREGDMGNVPRDNALLAQAEATLALVEQQRIANIIAVATWNVEALRNGARKAGGEVLDVEVEYARVDKMFAEVQEALRLR